MLFKNCVGQNMFSPGKLIANAAATKRVSDLLGQEKRIGGSYVRGSF